MLRGIRKASSNWLGKTIMTFVMGVLIVSFAIWGIGDMFKGGTQTTVATVGNAKITTDQFRQLFTDKLQQIGRQFGRPITSEQARAFGLDRQLLQQAVAEAALDEDARLKGLAVSDEEVMRQILNDPNFKGANGAFDASRFQQLIRQLGYTEQRYITEQRRLALRRQLAGTISAGIEPSNTMIEALSRYQNEERTVDYIKLGAAQAGEIETPSAEVLAKYFEENKIRFRAPEYRKIAYLALTPEELARWKTISDADARKTYEAARERMSTPETREISQIVFPNAEEAAAGRAKLNDSFSFEDLAKERGLSESDIDLGSVNKAGIIDKPIADAAFALSEGAVSEPLKGTFGTVLVKVRKITAGTTPSYESVADQIKRELALEAATNEVRDMHNKVEDERAGGANVIDTAAKLNLKAVTIDAVDRSGRGPNGQPVANLPQGLDIVSPAFTSDVGVDNDAVQFNGGYVWYDVLETTPSRERTLDEVKAEVETSWRNSQIAQRLRAKTDELVAKLDKGATLATEAEALGLKVETSAAFKRGANVAGLSAGVIDIAFRTPKDGYAQANGANEDERYVLRVTNVTVPAVDLTSEGARTLADTLRSGLTDEQVAQYVNHVETKVGTKINAQALAIATGAAAAN